MPLDPALFIPAQCGFDAQSTLRCIHTLLTDSSFSFWYILISYHIIILIGCIFCVQTLTSWSHSFCDSDINGLYPYFLGDHKLHQKHCYIIGQCEHTVTAIGVSRSFSEIIGKVWSRRYLESVLTLVQFLVIMHSSCRVSFIFFFILASQKYSKQYRPFVMYSTRNNDVRMRRMTTKTTATTRAFCSVLYRSLIPEISCIRKIMIDLIWFQIENFVRNASRFEIRDRTLNSSWDEALGAGWTLFFKLQ